MRSGTFLLLCLSAPMLAQIDTGAISGVVTDGTGSSIPNARITIIQTETGVQNKLTTNTSGFYSAPALRPGIYSVGAAADGFRAETRTGIELRVQERLEISFQLEVGATASEITVSAETPKLESGNSSLAKSSPSAPSTTFLSTVATSSSSPPSVPEPSPRTAPPSATISSLMEPAPFRTAIFSMASKTRTGSSASIAAAPKLFNP